MNSSNLLGASIYWNMYHSFIYILCAVCKIYINFEKVSLKIPVRKKGKKKRTEVFKTLED